MSTPAASRRVPLSLLLHLCGLDREISEAGIPGPLPEILKSLRAPQRGPIPAEYRGVLELRKLQTEFTRIREAFADSIRLDYLLWF